MSFLLQLTSKPFIITWGKISQVNVSVCASIAMSWKLSPFHIWSDLWFLLFLTDCRLWFLSRDAQYNLLYSFFPNVTFWHFVLMIFCFYISALAPSSIPIRIDIQPDIHTESFNDNMIYTAIWSALTSFYLCCYSNYRGVCDLSENHSKRFKREGFALMLLSLAYSSMQHTAVLYTELHSTASDFDTTLDSPLNHWLNWNSSNNQVSVLLFLGWSSCCMDILYNNIKKRVNTSDQVIG